MTVFADSSALVKLYVPEAHHRAVRAISDPIVISTLAHVEVPAAFWRKHRIGDITSDDTMVLSASFSADAVGQDLPAPRFATVPVSGRVVDSAADAVARYPLRAFDAVQLASALVVRRARRARRIRRIRHRSSIRCSDGGTGTPPRVPRTHPALTAPPAIPVR